MTLASTIPGPGWPEPLSPAAMTARLVAFDTVSARSNLPCVAWIRDYLAAYGVEAVVLPNAAGDKATLFATIGPAEVPGVVLSGHLDVVPVEGQAWSTDPFTATAHDGRLYGRGTCDMKGFCATALALVPEFLAAGLRAPIHLCFSYDEEVTCLGPLDAIARFGHAVPRPRACIVGEPTGMEVVDAQKSLQTYRTVVTGRPAHSSLPDLGANALHAAARLVVEIDRIAAELRAAGDPSGRFDPPFSTLQASMLAAGRAINIVPDRAEILWECRGVPGLALDTVTERLARFATDTVEPALKATAPEAGIETERLALVPPLAPDPGSAAETLALRLAGRNRTLAVAYGTEAGHFQAAGVPTVICGPGHITEAHRADEWIALDQLDACAAFLRGLAAELAG